MPRPPAGDSNPLGRAAEETAEPFPSEAREGPEAPKRAFAARAANGHPSSPTPGQARPRARGRFHAAPLKPDSMLRFG